jgi:ATP-dependent Lon protease
MYERITRPGTAIGLAYTEAGGRALLIETAKYPGTGMMNLTGKLGDVMKESVNTAFSWIKSNASRIGILKSLSTLSVHDDDDPQTHHRELRRSELIFK